MFHRQYIEFWIVGRPTIDGNDKNSDRHSGGFQGKKKLLVTILTVIPVALLFLLCAYCWWKKAKGRKMKGRHGVVFNDNEIEESNKGSELPPFSFSVIAAVTNNFSESNLVGKGGFGPVYKVCLHFICHLIQGGNQTRSITLDWRKRFNIIVGIARGILYLHEDSSLRIIHRDLKVSNILLDDDMNPKISDFGMARIFGGNQTQANTNRVVGTYGYMSPEYAMDGLFSMKSDVFSFGVILLEIISGKRNKYNSDHHSMNLIGHVWELWKEDRISELLDSSISISASESEVLKCIQVGLLCVQEKPKDRPSMSSVIFMLSKETTMPAPKQPTFCVWKGNYSDHPHSSTNGVSGCSRNEVSITEIQAR
ncbi:receptor-like serine/threonine-protein kinase SD1-8 [Cinnamomum micranthum f. kanehirae]|uniref:Receptor-like serine/threonine-protein kinase SD1-8 n=1 Tax=Cinnamomum micranthum f. kanehirae TaxID=337451 RepID=A0A3S3NA67_9MAGN|nr:receptor-like serine/threonine-protein kinase SD1-8 [Cinnamomum micranthum f. kanehirae]